MLEYFILISLIVGAGCWVIYPLFKPFQIHRSFSKKIDERLNQLELRKEEIYATIKELEFDLKMGKLSKEDYGILNDQYSVEAIDCLKEIDELRLKNERKTDPTEQDIEGEIEREISMLRSDQSTKSTSIFCTQCGLETSRGDKFCSHCGAKLVNSQ